MNEPTFRVRHTVSGKITEVAESQFSVFEDVLEKVDENAKELEPGMFKPGTVEEREARSASARKAAETRKANAEAAESGAPEGYGEVDESLPADEDPEVPDADAAQDAVQNEAKASSTKGE